jgi:hypothetical protein
MPPTDLQMPVTDSRDAVVLEQDSETPTSEERPFTSGHPTFAERLIETVPLITAPAFFGPPVIFLLGPWLLLVLLMIGPVALLITFVILAAAAAGLLVALGALIASPFLLVRHLRARHQAAAPARPVKASLRPRLSHLAAR